MKREERIFAVFFFVLLFLLFASIALLIYFRTQDESLRLIFLDVGQGDAIYARLPEGQDLLIDGGPGRKVLAELADVLPWWDRVLELVVLTHPHDDHVAGLAAVAARYRLANVWLGPERGLSPASVAWEKSLAEKNIRPDYFGDTDEYIFSPACRLKHLDTGTSESKDDLNAASAVLRLDCASTSVLSMADAGQAEEDYLLASGADIDVDILKVGHHGSGYSSGREFLEAVSPRIAVIQVGAGNDYGHPSAAVLNRLEAIGAAVYRTDLEGRIDFRIASGEPERQKEGALDFSHFFAIIKRVLR